MRVDSYRAAIPFGSGVSHRVPWYSLSLRQHPNTLADFYGALVLMLWQEAFQTCRQTVVHRLCTQTDR